MTKADLIEVVAKKASLTAKAAREAVGAVFGSITDSLKKGDKVVVTGFGTFMVRSQRFCVQRRVPVYAGLSLLVYFTYGNFPFPLKKVLQGTSKRARINGN